MNKLYQIIQTREQPYFPFKPNHDFFKKIGIGKKRFWAMVRNEVQPTLDEVKKVADAFGVKATDIIDI